MRWACPGRANGFTRSQALLKTIARIYQKQKGGSIYCNRRWQTTGPIIPSSLAIDGRIYPTDSWTNVPASILSAIPRRLHLQPSHPILLTRQLIESHFPSPTYAHHNTLPPVVTVSQNFDSLDFPADHPGRSRTDTYYVNKDTVLRTHTSAHQADIFRQNASDGYTISADVYRRDAIDRSHNPVFHQMEGARMWDRRKVPGGDVVAAVRKDIEELPKHSIDVIDPYPTLHPDRNPLQDKHHTLDEVEAIATHLKRSLEAVIIDIFAQAQKASAASAFGSTDEEVHPSPNLQVRWVEAYFPFTSPSWELEIFWQDSWLEVLGCGVVLQDIPNAAGVSSQLGWAFGIGLERIAMLLFSIPDIRLFWSRDPRFLSQFSTLDAIRPFRPFSKFPACYKDVAFWLDEGGAAAFHENDVMEVVREVGGDLVEDVRIVDDFRHARSGRRSLCYRVNYRSLDRTLENLEINGLQREVERQLVLKLGVELR